MRMCRGYPGAVQQRVHEDLQIVQEGVHEEEEVQEGVQDAEERVQEQVQEQLQLVLFCTSATTTTHMTSRAGGAAEDEAAVMHLLTPALRPSSVAVRPPDTRTVP